MKSFWTLNLAICSSGISSVAHATAFTDVSIWGGLDTNLYQARIEDASTDSILLAQGGNGMLFGLSAAVRNIELGK